MPPKKDENKHYYGFDPAGLEKGAKVIKNRASKPFRLLKSLTLRPTPKRLLRSLWKVKRPNK